MSLQSAAGLMRVERGAVRVDTVCDGGPVLRKRGEAGGQGGLRHVHDCQRKLHVVLPADRAQNLSSRVSSFLPEAPAVIANIVT
jgi:hypothetical protein